MADIDTPNGIRRAMRDELNRGDNGVWHEYHRLRRLLADTCGLTLRQADQQARACLPDGSLPR